MSDKNEANLPLKALGGIADAGISHRNGNKYLKSLPDDKENNNLSNLPSISQRDSHDSYGQGTRPFVFSKRKNAPIPN